MNIITYFQGEQCHQLCNNLAKKSTVLRADAMFIKAAQFSREGKPKEAAKLLIEHAVGDKELPMKLASVQVLLSQDERKEAIAILENLSENNKFLPGIVSALVTLHMADNNRERASAVLKDAVAYYKVNKVCSRYLNVIISLVYIYVCKRISTFNKLHKRSIFRKLLQIWENYGDRPPIFICVGEKLKLLPISCKN